jgi:methionine-rich copper-binding protein CopC
MAVRLLAACLWFVLGAVGGPASAHTELVAGSPGPNDVLRDAATGLTLTFVSPLVPEGTQVLVRDPRGVDHAGDVAVTGSTVDVPVTPLRRAGSYTVAYRAVAVDGHPVTGSYTFTVSRAAAEAAQGQSAAAGDPRTASGNNVIGAADEAPRAAVSAPSGPTWVIGVLGIGTLAALLWIGAGRRSHRHEAED